MTKENIGQEIRLETSRFLKQGRTQKNLSLRQAAKGIGVSPFYLQGLEDGTEEQSLYMVCRVLEFYNSNRYIYMDWVNRLMLTGVISQEEQEKH